MDLNIWHTVNLSRKSCSIANWVNAGFSGNILFSRSQAAVIPKGCHSSVWTAPDVTHVPNICVAGCGQSSALLLATTE